VGVSQKVEVLVTDGVVTGISPTPGAGALKENTIALVGREGGATALAGLKVGDRVEVSYGLKSSAGEMDVAIGGSQPLVRGGEVLPQGDKSVHPRTAVGFSKDRSTMFLATVDGRMADSRGMSLEDLGTFLKDMGADSALNLDGGGSSTLVAREAGEAGVEVENTPSDGYQRAVPNGLALFAAKGSGRPTGLRVVPDAGDDDENLLRVFPGLTRELGALGHDETYAPVEVGVKYRSNPAAVGAIDGDGTFTARRSGDVTVTASSRAASGELPLVVLGDLERVRSTAEKVSLKDASDTGEFGLVGYDADGFQAPIDPADITLEYDTTKILVEPNTAGGFSVKPVAESAGVVIKATVDGIVAHVAVSVGLESRIAAGFDDAAGWKWSGARSTGSVAPTPGRDGGTALQINYDFTQSTATRTSNAAPPKRITVDGQPQTIGLWVKGDGRGQWWSFSILDAKGTSYPLYGPHITWTGWQYVEVDVPQGIAFPMTLTRFGIIETAATAKYAGSVAIDDITVKVAPSVEIPATEQPADDVVITEGKALDGEDFTFAVVSDAQFTASDQSLVPAARRTLREAVAAGPEFIVINGDWIDTAFPEDLALARRVIEEEIGDKVPWYYVPGNHEIYGPGTVDPFEAEFGPAHQGFVHKGTQFVLLDSSTGRLLGGGFDQWQMLRSSLDTARDTPSINGVVVLSHMPPRDPSPIKVSQLSSSVEVGVVEDWLSDFRRDSGKGAAYIGSHVGSFSAASVDGVPYIVNGNAGKTPSTAPAEGGFSGWSLVGINPLAEPAPLAARHRSAPESHSGNPWLEVEMRPHVDKLTIDNPGVLAAGTSASLQAHVTQGRRTFPVAYPVSADWSSERVHVGAAQEAPAGSIAAYDPETHTLTALRAGEGSLSVTVNDATEAIAVTVTE
jgi:3',5'-cyclic AMP phosphodiesterase CpdA